MTADELLLELRKGGVVTRPKGLSTSTWSNWAMELRRRGYCVDTASGPRGGYLLSSESQLSDRDQAFVAQTPLCDGDIDILVDIVEERLMRRLKRVMA